VKDGKIVLNKSFGPVTNKTIFPIYSYEGAGVAVSRGTAATVAGDYDATTVNAPVGVAERLSLLDPVTYGLPHGTTEEQALEIFELNVFLSK